VPQVGGKIARPMKMPSTLSTDAMASISFDRRRVSTCTSTHVSL
jgi:hypothetical protein